MKELNTIHHQGLRLALGTYSTSPNESLYTEAGEPPLTLRREELALQYSTKLKSCPSNPAYDCTFNLKYKQHFERKEKAIKPFGLRMMSNLQESKIPLINIHESIFPQTPPWIIKTPKVILELKEHSKTKTHPSTYQEKFYNILQHHPDHLYVSTDGSKDNGRAACMAVLNKTVLKKTLPRESSIFTAEACAIDLALNIISKSKHKKFIIFSNSLSVLLSLRNKKFQNPFIIKLLSRLDSMSNRKEIIICWTPSHIGVRGNERADSAAKSALDLTPDKSRIQYTDQQLINSFTQNGNNNGAITSTINSSKFSPP